MNNRWTHILGISLFLVLQMPRESMSEPSVKSVSSEGQGLIVRIVSSPDPGNLSDHFDVVSISPTGLPDAALLEKAKASAVGAFSEFIDKLKQTDPESGFGKKFFPAGINQIEFDFSVSATSIPISCKFKVLGPSPTPAANPPKTPSTP